jgi:hypothetical protein
MHKKFETTGLVHATGWGRIWGADHSRVDPQS